MSTDSFEDVCKMEGCYCPEDWKRASEIANTPLWLRLWFAYEVRKKLGPIADSLYNLNADISRTAFIRKEPYSLEELEHINKYLGNVIKELREV